MTEPLHEVALAREEVEQILRACDGQAVLVGGQALAYWAQHYQIRPLDVLKDYVTLDADFLGGKRIAREMAKSLAGWKLWEPSMDDATPQSAKLSWKSGDEIKQVDFLSTVLGLNTEGVRKRAVESSLPEGVRLLVLHPLDVLESRMCNLAALPSKRNAQGVAQAELSIDVVRCFMQQLLESGQTGVLFDAIKRVGKIAKDRRHLAAFHEHGLDPLRAIPADRIHVEMFHARGWPQLKAQVQELRDKYVLRQKRQR